MTVDARYVRIVAGFVSGDMSLPEFSRFVEERLFELRQQPEMTDEKMALSSIELYMHEAEEGLRDKAEVYSHVRFILDDILAKLTSTTYSSPALSELTYSFVDNKKTETRELSLATGK
jgi:hypothetical protein